MSNSDYLNFAEKVIQTLVAHPEDVKVEKTVNAKGVLLTVQVKPEDLSQLIGKNGRTINAVRKLVRMVGLKEKAFVSIKVLEK